MAKVTLTPNEIKRATALLTDYFAWPRAQSRLQRDTQEGEQQQDRFTGVLTGNARLNDQEFLTFLHDEIWAIHESLRFGLLDEIVQSNSTAQLRAAFQNMVLEAPNIPDPDAVLAIGKRPYLGNAILSEVLCKVYPDRFSIKNKRSIWGLYFILDGTAPDHIENEMSYANFIGISWQIWDLIQQEYQQRNLVYDAHRRLWYVDRFHLWIYERPETKQIMKLMGHND